MISNDKDKSRNSPEEERPARVVEDEVGRNVWEGTIRTIKLSILKTGIFRKAQVQESSQELQEQDRGDASIDPSEEHDLSVTEVGFDPYDSSWKK